MPEGMFGAPVGISQGIADQRQLALTALSQGQVAMQPLEMANIAAQTRLHTAQAGAAELQLTGEREMVSKLSQIGSGQTDAYKIGDMYARSGLFKQAREWMNLGSLMDARAATANAADARRGLTAYQTQKAQLDLIGRSIATVNSQADFDAWKQQMAPLLEPAEREQLAKTPFSAEIKAQISQQALSTKERLDLEFKNRQEARRDTMARSTQAYRAGMLNLRRQSVEQGNLRTKAYVKIAGGNEDKPPPAAVRNDMATMILQHYPFMEDKVARMHGSEIFTMAKQLRAKNPGLSWKEARGQAFTVYQKNGQFGKAKLSALGETPDTASPPPKSGKYIDRTWYKNDQGQTAFYMGGKMYSQQELLGMGESGEDEDEGED